MCWRRAASHDGYSTAEADDLVNVSRIGVGVSECTNGRYGQGYLRRACEAQAGELVAISAHGKGRMR